MPHAGVVFSLIAIPIMFFYHPVAIVCFAVDALLALWAGWRSPETRHRMFVCCGCFALLTFAAVLRMQVFSNEYETEQLRLGVWVWTFLVGVGGAPLHAILLTWLAGALLVLERFAGRFSMALWSIALSVIATAFILLGGWAHDTAEWQYAFEFRSWALWLSLPVVILAAIDSAPPSLTFRRWATLLIGVGFLFVLLTQALAWKKLKGPIAVLVPHHSGCVKARHLEGIPNAALAHWTVTAQSMLMQGKQTSAIAYYLESCGSPDRRFQSGYYLSI